MESVPDDRTPPTAPPRRGWFSRVPMWVRIAVPALVLAGVIAAVVVALWPRPEPVDVARSMCLSGVRDELEASDRDVTEMPLFSDVEQVDGSEYRTQGSVAYSEAGETERRTVRCIVRADGDGELVVASIRFGPG
jgi:hypothetical protein